TSHSSGPSHRAALSPCRVEVLGLVGSDNPSAEDSAETLSAGARSESWLAGAAGETSTQAWLDDCPASATLRSASAMEAFSLLVEENRAGQFHLDHPVLHRYVKRLAHA